MNDKCNFEEDQKWERMNVCSVCAKCHCPGHETFSADEAKGTIMNELRLLKLLTVKEKEVELAEAELELIRVDLQQANEQHLHWEDRAAKLEYVVGKLLRYAEAFGADLGYWKTNFPIVIDILEVHE